MFSVAERNIRSAVVPVPERDPLVFDLELPGQSFEATRLLGSSVARAIEAAKEDRPSSVGHVPLSVHGGDTVLRLPMVSRTDHLETLPRLVTNGYGRDASDLGGPDASPSAAYLQVHGHRFERQVLPITRERVLM